MAGIFFRIFRIVHSYMHYVFIKASNDLGLFEVLFFLFFFSWKEKETKSSRRFDAEQPLSLEFSSDESPERRLCYSETLGWRLRFVLCNVTKGGSIFPCMFYSRLMIYQVKNKALGQSLIWKSWHWSYFMLLLISISLLPAVWTFIITIRPGAIQSFDKRQLKIAA
jgi:hypothetical protein